MTGINPSLDRKIEAIDVKLQHVRTAIEDGLEDVQWANERLQQLRRERNELCRQKGTGGKPPKINSGFVRKQLRELDSVLEHGTPAKKKRLLREMIQKIELAPEKLEVIATYNIPGQLEHSYIAGGGFEPPTSGL